MVVDALQLGGCTISRQSFWAVLAKLVLHVHSNYYFRAFDPNSDTTVGFSDPDFLYGTDIFAIGGHLRCEFDLERLKCIGCHVIKLCTRFQRNRTIRGLSYSELKIENLEPYAMLDLTGSKF